MLRKFNEYGSFRGIKRTGYGFSMRSARRQERNKQFRKLFRMGLIGGGILFVFGIIVFIQMLFQLPDVELINTFVPNETTKIYSADGAVLAELHQEENRIIMPIEKMSPYLKAAVLASEDSRFYQHYGIDPKGIFRAGISNIVQRGAAQGGSTITQQLARNIFLYKKKKLIRKVAEIILALQIERRYTKDEILEMYLNQVYWGHNAYGAESAALAYFGKSAKQLNLAESATLAGLLRAPELFSPFRNPSYDKWRKDLVLSRMLEVGYITKEQYFEAKETPINLTTRKTLRYKAPYFTSYVTKQLVKLFGQEVVFTQGLKVHTSLDYRLQKIGEDVVENIIEEGLRPAWVGAELVPSLNYSQAALLSVEAETGYIKTWVGGHDFVNAEYDHIVQAFRQPGSSFKPFIYYTALENGLSPGTVMEDAPVTFNTIEGAYGPTNYTKDYKGMMTLRRALEMSINVIAVKILDLVGPDKVIENCRKMGIKSYLQPVLSLALGSNEVNILEMTTAYGVLATGGIKVDPVSILKIEDRNGNVLFEHTISQKRVLNANIVALLIDMMRGVVLRGTGTAAALNDRPVAGKTGTTGDYRDAWFIGFTPQLVTTTWVGNNDNSPMQKITGGLVPAKMWKQFMEKAVQGTPVRYFAYPGGLVRQRICLDSGLLANVFCPSEKVVEELIWKERQLDRNCYIHTNFISLDGGGARPDWESYFFPDTNNLIYLNNEKKVTKNVEGPKVIEKKKATELINKKKGL